MAIIASQHDLEFYFHSQPLQYRPFSLQKTNIYFCSYKQTFERPAGWICQLLFSHVVTRFAEISEMPRFNKTLTLVGLCCYLNIMPATAHPTCKQFPREVIWGGLGP